jgi:hypothetical protein
VRITNAPDYMKSDAFCGNETCTGIQNLLIIDEDGTMNQDKDVGGVFLPNNPTVAGLTGCLLEEGMNVYNCRYNTALLNQGRYGTLRFEDLTDEKYTRTFSPVYVTSEDDILNANSTNFSNTVANFRDTSRYVFGPSGPT